MGTMVQDFDYDELYDDDDYKFEARHNRISRKVFSKKKRESEEHIAGNIERISKRESRLAEKEAFFK